jgi:putative ABC transport system permease protein
MNLVAIKMLVGDKLKYLALVAGVAFAALLITQQASIFAGYALRTGAWVRDTGTADLWVMDDQVEFTEDIKPMLDTALQRVRGVAGVQWAVPMYKGYINAILPDGTRQNVRIVGLDDSTLTGAPPVMVEGQLEDLRRDRAVLMNAQLPIELKRSGEQGATLKVGDRLSFDDTDAVVVGSYAASAEFFWEPVFFTTYSRAKTLYKDQRKTLMYVLVKVDPGTPVETVAKRITQTTGLKALTGKEFERETMWWILNATGILVNFGITIGLGFVIGLLVAGQTLYTFILDNMRNFGALKAMGVGNGRLMMMMSVQVLLATCLGFGLGVGGASITGAAFAGGSLAFAMPWQIPVVGFCAVLICCLIAGVISMRRVLELEPAVVFR